MCAILKKAQKSAASDVEAALRLNIFQSLEKFIYLWNRPSRVLVSVFS